MKLLPALLLFLATMSVSASKRKMSFVDTDMTNFPPLKDLSQLEELNVMMRQANADNNNSSNNNGDSSAEISVYKQPCSCGGGVCSCCSRILMYMWKQKACVNVTYDPDEFSFTAKLMMNDRIFYTRTVSGKNPRPVCVPIPQFPVIKACVRLYNIYFQGRNVHACVNMEGRFRDTVLFKVGFDCIRLGANGVALVRPEDGGGIGQIEFLPAEAGDDDDEYDDDDDEDYDEVEDDNDDDDDDDDY